MRVKRLEIQGFKSFKDKTVVHFDHRITGIVGPNGCGKSNIVDAFFWVMGEQSNKHMRASGSADLIFNGSSQYSPLGLAEATIVMETPTIDNENAPAGASSNPHLAGAETGSKEIAVTRRVYRSGEGEYFINGVQCRLKDIHELFMDTGVGAKGYSVIEQGQIGRIIQAKPEDRRQLIEEAAGIAKYKARKKESLRKMENAQGNLERLNDVVNEIERNLNSLERQAQKARRYKEYKKELFEKEMTWGRRKTLVMRRDLDARKKEKEALEQEVTGLRAELQTAENSIETDRVAQLTDNKAADELQNEVQELASELGQAENALELSRRRQDDLENQLQSLKSEKEELEVSIGNEKTGLEERRAGLEASEEELSALSAQVREAEEQVRASRETALESREQAESAKKELMDGISESTQLKSLSATLEARIESGRTQLAKLEGQARSLTERIEAARAEVERSRGVYEEVRSERTALESDITTVLDEVDSFERELKELEKAREESNRRLTQLSSRLESLEELVAAHEGLGNGPKAALDWADETGRKSQFRVLADVIDVAEGFEKAVEGWLDARLETLIAENSSAAMDAIVHLREEKQGRAVFHVGSGASGSVGVSADEARSALGSAGFNVRGILNEFARASEAAGGIRTEAFFDRVLVVESMGPLSAAGEVSSWMPQGWALVSIDGDVLTADGILRGGSTESGSAASILGRKRAIQELQEKVAEATREYEELDGRTDRKRTSLDESLTRSREMQSKLQSLEVRSAALERDVQQAERSLHEAEEQSTEVQVETAEVRGREEEAQSELAEVREKLETIDARRTELESGIFELNEKLGAKEEELQSQEARHQELRIEEASLRERTQSTRRELESTLSFIENREGRLRTVSEMLEKLSSERAEHSGGDTGYEEKIAELNRQLAAKKEELAHVKDRLEQSGAKLNDALGRIKSLHKETDEKAARVSDLAVEVERLSGDLGHLIQNLEEKYGPGCLDTPTEAGVQEEMEEPVVTQEMSAEEERELGEEVDRLRERIRRLGEVNTMAIEEYEELRKRYDYLRDERADLEQSIDNLQAAIDHINKTSKERFAKAFDAIANRFERLFPIIFGGGRAQLSLVYPEDSNDSLDAGVDILAQPPGKKIVNIGLLSGGEKALTALSLLFAIFMVKPSPFCVLDEVDAPLDDSNIGKFNALLKEMAAKSQFIVITHNKKTMELNDTLYGVTMEEPGVSKMVSIELQ